MKTQFIQRYFDPVSSAAGAAAGMTPVGLAVGGLQTILGTVQTIVGSERAKRLQQMLRPYETPDEVFQILNATKNLASQGYDPATLAYLTNQTDNAFASSAGLAKRLGADANTLSNLFNDKIQATMRIGAENHALNMENFSKYLSALSTVSENKAAEQKSKNDIIKDKIQAAVADKQAGLQNISGGFNTALSTISASKSNKLFTAGKKGVQATTGGTASNDLIQMLIQNLINGNTTAEDVAIHN